MSSKVIVPTLINTVDPVVTDDSSQGIHVGWRWLNSVSQSEFLCVSDAVGAAVWNPVGSSALSEPAFSPLDWYVVNAASAPTSLAGNWSLGCAVTPLRAVRITGIRFYWASASGQTVVCKLWDDTASAVKTVSVSTSGIGIYSGYFSTPYDTPSNKINYRHYVTIRENTGTVYTRTNAASSAAGVDNPITLSAPGVRFEESAICFYVAGDARPTTISTGNLYPVEAIFDMDV